MTTKTIPNQVWHAFNAVISVTRIPLRGFLYADGSAALVTRQMLAVCGPRGTLEHEGDPVARLSLDTIRWGLGLVSDAGSILLDQDGGELSWNAGIAKRGLEAAGETKMMSRPKVLGLTPEPRDGPVAFSSAWLRVASVFLGALRREVAFTELGQVVDVPVVGTGAVVDVEGSSMLLKAASYGSSPNEWEAQVRIACLAGFEGHPSGGQPY